MGRNDGMGWRQATLALVLAVAALPACGAEAGAAARGEETIPLPDPLDLAACETDAAAWERGIDLPGLDWNGTGDEHAVHCAFRALDEVLADKAIICAGENDHGVSESTRWHAALARYLIHRWGVRVIALEVDAAGIEHWNRYLASGDPDDLAAGFEGAAGTLFDAWEQAWFVESLRAVQAELPAGERLRLTGYDIAVQTTQTVRALLGFLERVLPDEVETWRARWASRNYQQAATQTAGLFEQIEANRESWIAATDLSTWEAARTHAANLRDGFFFLHHYMRGGFGTGNATYREPGMIRNVEELAAGLEEGERLMLVSHNLHCARQMPASGAASIDESPALGTHLARSPRWGSQYLMIAHLYQRGHHNLQGYPDLPFESARSSLSGALDQLAQGPALLIGTGAAEPDMGRRWNVQSFGIVNDSMVPSEQFDGILWVREVAATSLR